MDTVICTAVFSGLIWVEINKYVDPSAKTRFKILVAMLNAAIIIFSAT